MQEDTFRLTKLGFEHKRPECMACAKVEVILTVNYGSLNLGPVDNSFKCSAPGYDHI